MLPVMSDVVLTSEIRSRRLYLLQGWVFFIAIFTHNQTP